MSDNIYSDGEYLNQNPTWHVEDSGWKADQIISILKNNSIEPLSVCEIGCGAGEILNQMHSRMGGNVRFTGYEISPQAYKLCESRAKDRLRFHLKDPFEDDNNNHDVVLAIDVIEHVEDYYGFLRKMKTKGHYKIFHIPLDMTVQAVFRTSPILKGRGQFGHIHYFSKDTALAALRDTGYEIVDYAYTGSTVENKNIKSFKSMLAQYPRIISFKINADWAVRILGGYSILVLAR